MSDMKHIVLLGDSVFDNKAYVNGGLGVISQVRRQIPDGWRASLRAVDGSVIENARKQALDLPDDAVHTENSGWKIANAIVRLVSEHDFESRRTEVFI